MTDGFSIATVIQANQAVKRYHVTLRYGSNARYEADIDESAQYQHVLYGLGKVFPQVEAFWHGNKGLARKIAWKDWLALSVQPSPVTLRQTLDMVASLPVASVSKGADVWDVEFNVDGLPPRDKPQQFFSQMLGNLQSIKKKAFLDSLVGLAPMLKATLTVRVSLDTLLIRQVRAVLQVGGRVTDVVGTFAPSSAQLPPYPQATPPARAAVLPLEMIAIPMRDIGGWMRHRHCIAAQQAIDLIETADRTAGLYKEIYQNPWFSTPYTESSSGAPVYTVHHPILIGTHHEDHDDQFPRVPYLDWFGADPRFKDTPNIRPGNWMRSMHHFGGYGDGLRYQWYFAVLDLGTHVPDPEVGDRFYSARDWGYGIDRIDETRNRMTFTEAIRQYNTYTEEGKVKAYVMLGHVIHLLQDQGQPDHSRLHDHGGSSYNEAELFEEYQICTIRASLIAAEAAALCGPFYWVCFGATFALVLAACIETADPQEVGFEYLTNQEHNSAAGSILDCDRYDTFFAEMSDRAITEADRLGLTSPLGCGDLWLPPPLYLAPTLDPDIHMNNPAECQPYWDLYDAVMPQIVGISAGLIRHFYEIVNHPPYLERVAIVKGVAGKTPVAFGQIGAEVGDDWTAALTCYAAEWRPEVGDPSRRRKAVTADRAISPGHQAYVFLQFGPNLNPEGRKKVRNLSVQLTGVASDGTRITEPVTMTETSDATSGTFYWGAFQPHNPTSEPYDLTLEVSAHDATAHLQRRVHPGDALDADPRAVAGVDVLTPPLYPLLDYVPGTDRNHVVKVGPMFTVDTIEPNDNYATATPLELAVGSPSPSYPILTLHNQADIDRFLISFPATAFDGSATSWTHDVGAGLFLQYRPAGLSVAAQEFYDAGLTLDLRYSSLVYPVANPEAARHEITIEAPATTFVNRQVYLSLSNQRFAAQGPLMYVLTVAYSPACFVLTGRLLTDYGCYLPLPPELNGYELIGDPIESIVYRDPGCLLTHLAQYQQRYLRLLRIESERELQHVGAIMGAGLGRAAYAAGLYSPAERTLREAASILQRLAYPDEAPVLHLLQRVYLLLGRGAEAAAIGTRLKELSPFVPYPEVRSQG